MKVRHYWRGWTQRVPDYGLVRTRKCAFPAFELHGQGFFVQTQHEQLDDVKVPFTSFGLPLTLGEDACGYHPPRTNPATRVECQSLIVFPTNTYRDSSPVCSVFFSWAKASQKLIFGLEYGLEAAQGGSTVTLQGGRVIAFGRGRGKQSGIFRTKAPYG